MSRNDTHPGLWALAVTAFAIGVTEFIVVGVLPAIAADLDVPLARAGGLVGLYALALAIGTPLVVLGLARQPRKPVLLALVAVFLAGNLLSALSTSYAMLLAGRVITAVAHGSFFAIGATVAARLAPEGQASRAIALMFAGLTLAMVIGVPLGSLIGNGLGWRLPFFAVALLAALGWLATARWVPTLPAQTAGRAGTQLATLVQPEILAMMSITILGFGASFAAFTFITPILTDITGFSTHAASLLLMVFGAATLLGNFAGGRWAASLGWPVALRRMLAGLLLAFVALALLMPWRAPMVLLLFAWGLLAFGMSPGFQAGMLATAGQWTPRAVDFASALNISAFNLGITLGETLGSALVARDAMALTPWVGVGLAALAQVPLMWLARRSSNTPSHASCRLRIGRAMELRHLRYFLAVAEELRFARAAEKLHIEQSPLSRAIKELEEELGVALFIRTTRSTRLTRAGKLLMEHVPRIFAALQQARDSVKAAANGFHGQLRVALSDGITPSRLPALLALCRQEEPEVDLRFFEVPLSQQIKGLHDDLYDVGFAQSDEVGDGIAATPVWSDALMVAVPARHPLLAHKRIPLNELLRYPLVLCDPQVCEGHAKHVERVLRRADMEPLIAERVASCDLMMALVSAGFALGLTGEAHIATSREAGVVARPLASRVPPLTTYLLRLGGEPSDVLARFIERVEAIESPESPRPIPGHHSDLPEEPAP